MKVLIFRITRSDSDWKTYVWDVSDIQKRRRAYSELFKLIDEELDPYSMNGDSVVCALLNPARSGNPEAAEALLCYRKNKGGEQFEEAEVM